MSKSFFQSLFFHLLVVAPILYFSLNSTKVEEKPTTVVVVEKFKVVAKPPPPVEIVKKPLPPPPKARKVKKVFGLSKKSITTKKGLTKVKIGNTVAKAPDKEKLDKDDDEQLPLPADEFLISSMPAVVEEFRPRYPARAKAAGKEGKVVFSVLIDEKGRVRSAEIIQSLDPEMDQQAKKAMMQFRFRPAKINDKPVASKIKYAINFILQ